MTATQAPIKKTATTRPTAQTKATMRAFVMNEIGKIGIIDKPVPRPGPNDAIIRTTAALIESQP